MDSVRPPAEVGGVRVAGVVVDGSGVAPGGAGGASRDDVEGDTGLGVRATSVSMATRDGKGAKGHRGGDDGDEEESPNEVRALALVEQRRTHAPHPSPLPVGTRPWCQVFWQVFLSLSL